MLRETFAEAFRTSADGWIDDLLAFCAPWGSELDGPTTALVRWETRALLAPFAGPSGLPAGCRGADRPLHEGLDAHRRRGQ
ncbi:hypothetical protein GCM10009727_60520 [Actinomadura napierensis]|uniref:Transposase n=2 Tax=Actinomadura napierensis TaxID=267854 RepID=A0ABN3A4Q1_9ACTN